MNKRINIAELKKLLNNYDCENTYLTVSNNSLLLSTKRGETIAELDFAKLIYTRIFLEEGYE